MQKIVLLRAQNDGSVKAEPTDLSFLEQAQCDYVLKLPRENSALSDTAVYAFLAVFQHLLYSDEELVDDLPLWEIQLAYDAAIMLTASESSEDNSSQLATRRRHAHIFADFASQKNCVEWQRRVELMNTCASMALPNVFDFKHHSAQIKRCMIDAWRLFPLAMLNPRIEFVGQHSWTAALGRIDSARGYTATSQGERLRDLLYPNFVSYRQSIEGDSRITDAILAQQMAIANAQQRIQELVASCPHPVEKQNEIFKGDSGNYDPSADWSAKEVTCTVCGNLSYYEGTRNGYQYRHSTIRQLPIELKKA